MTSLETKISPHQWVEQVDSSIESFKTDLPFVPADCKNDFSKGEWREIECAADVTASDYFICVLKYNYPDVKGGQCSFARLLHRDGKAYVDGEMDLDACDPIIVNRRRKKTLIGAWLVWKRLQD